MLSKEITRLLEERNERPFWWPYRDTSTVGPEIVDVFSEVLELQGFGHPGWERYRIRDTFSIVNPTHQWVYYRKNNRTFLKPEKGIKYILSPFTGKVEIYSPGMVNILNHSYSSGTTTTQLMVDGLKENNFKGDITQTGNDIYLNDKKVSGYTDMPLGKCGLRLELSFLNTIFDSSWNRLLPDVFKQPITGILNEDSTFDLYGFFKWLYDYYEEYRR